MVKKLKMTIQNEERICEIKERNVTGNFENPRLFPHTQTIYTIYIKKLFLFSEMQMTFFKLVCVAEICIRC